MVRTELENGTFQSRGQRSQEVALAGTDGLTEYSSLLWLQKPTVLQEEVKAKSYQKAGMMRVRRRYLEAMPHEEEVVKAP